MAVFFLVSRPWGSWSFSANCHMDHRTPLVAASEKNEKTNLDGVEPVVVVVVTVRIDCRLAQPGASTGSILPTKGSTNKLP